MANYIVERNNRQLFTTQTKLPIGNKSLSLPPRTLIGIGTNENYSEVVAVGSDIWELHHFYTNDNSALASANFTFIDLSMFGLNPSPYPKMHVWLIGSGASGNAGSSWRIDNIFPTWFSGDGWGTSPDFNTAGGGAGEYLEFDLEPTVLPTGLVKNYSISIPICKTIVDGTLPQIVNMIQNPDSVNTAKFDIYEAYPGGAGGFWGTKNLNLDFPSQKALFIASNGVLSFPGGSSGGAGIVQDPFSNPLYPLPDGRYSVDTASAFKHSYTIDGINYSGKANIGGNRAPAHNVVATHTGGGGADLAAAGQGAVLNGVNNPGVTSGRGLDMILPGTSYLIKKVAGGACFYADPSFEKTGFPYGAGRSTFGVDPSLDIPCVPGTGSGMAAPGGRGAGGRCTVAFKNIYYHT